MKFNKKNVLLTVLGSIVVITITLISFFNRPVRVEMGKDNIKISGINGLDLKMEDIEEVTLKEVLPQGINNKAMKKSGSISVGNFKPNDGEETKVFTYSKEGPYLYITTKNKSARYVIINYKNRKQTEELYKIILSKASENN